MNREIKFRVWDNFNEQFLKSDTANLNFLYNGQWLPVSKFIGSESYTIQQFTGLKDKNGKEIYEGDIISYWPSCAKGYNNTTVKVPELTAFHWFAELEMMLDKSEYPNQCEIEVIGNIFKNPNLLDNTRKIKNRIKLKKFN